MSAPKDAILNKALEQHNEEVAKQNVARVRSEMSVIATHKATIAGIEKQIAEAQKRIASYSATPDLTSKDVMA